MNAPQGGKTEGDLFDLPNIGFMGTAVISGSGLALVLRTGDGVYSACTNGGIIRADVIRCFYRHHHEATQQEAATQCFPARDSECYLHDDRLHVGHGANCKFQPLLRGLHANLYRYWSSAARLPETGAKLHFLASPLPSASFLRCYLPSSMPT